MKQTLFMKKITFFFLILFAHSWIYSQQKDSFPENAIGVYKGTLVIDSPKGKQEIDMEFHMRRTDSLHRFDYVLIYDGKPRNYTLIIKNKKKGICEVDENNGIILPSRFSGTTLYSFFEVQGSLLSSRLDFSKDQMVFEILFSATKNKTASGGTSKEIPEVVGYPITVVQKAILKKEN